MPPQDDSGRERGPDFGTAGAGDLDERLADLEAPDPSAVPIPEGAIPGFNGQTAALVAGGVFSLWAVRALANRRLRAIPYGIVGAALLVRGLSSRAGDTEKLSLDDHSLRSTEGGSTEPGRTMGSAGKPGQTSETSGNDDEIASDPRTTDGVVDVDRSTEPTADEMDEPPTADEASEATGPKPAQAEPTRTDATEPEDTAPEDDSSSTADTERTDGDGTTPGSDDEEGIVDTDDEE